MLILTLYWWDIWFNKTQYFRLCLLSVNKRIPCAPGEAKIIPSPILFYLPAQWRLQTGTSRSPESRHCVKLSIFLSWILRHKSSWQLWWLEEHRSRSHCWLELWWWIHGMDNVLNCHRRRTLAPWVGENVWAAGLRSPWQTGTVRQLKNSNSTWFLNQMSSFPFY